MKAVGSISGWIIAAILLVLIIVAGSVIISQKASQGQAIDIAVEQGREIMGKIYVGGEVNNPGYYTIFAGDKIDDIITAAGGLKEGANLDSLELTICQADNEYPSQKININRAEAWLLEALPGIGETKAQAIIEYRQQHGLFRDINELMQVPGFGDAIFTQIKGFITVND